MQSQARKLGKSRGLRAKILNLVAVPLIFEVLVALALMYFQHLYVQSVADEAERKVIIYKTNRLWLQTASMMIDHSALNFGIKKNSDSHWKKDYENIQARYDELRMMLRRPEQLRRLDDLKAYLDKIHSLSRPPDKSVSLENASSENLGDVLKALKATKRLMKASIQIGKAFREFKQPLLDDSKAAEQKIESNRRFIEYVLVTAVAGSILVAVFMFRYFIGDIYSEIEAILENIEQFKSGKPLTPAKDTGHELALLHYRFHQIAKEVQQAQAEKREFVQTISRYLRDPLNRVLDYVAWLSGDEKLNLDTKTRDGAKRSQKSLQRLIMLLDDLLALNERMRPELDIVPRVVSVREIVASSVESMSGAGSPIEVDVVEDLYVMADPTRIVQVLVNLLSNAIKFSPRSVAVKVSAVESGESIEIRVKDSGRGIPANMRNSIFKPFKQVEASDGTRKGGTGLGLPICKHLVERHGGEIGVESELDKGATFWFRLPKATMAANSTHDQQGRARENKERA